MLSTRPYWMCQLSTAPRLRFSMRRAPSLTAFWLSLLLVGHAHALDPTRILTQYGHSAWRIQDGVIAGAVTSLAQTNDGYLWIGTRDGLFRFNGADLVPFKPTVGEPVRSPRILSLLAARDGSLWIGTGNDVEQLTSGRLSHYPSAVGYILSGVIDIKETRDSRIWIARTNIPTGEKPLCRVAGKELECFGTEQQVPLNYVMNILETPDGHLVVHSDDQVIDWDPVSQESHLVWHMDVGSDGIQSVAFSPNGSLLIGSVSSAKGYGLAELKSGHLNALKQRGFDGQSVPTQTLFLDSNKDLWVGTQGQGLYRIAHDRVEHVGSRDGLSSDSVNKIFEDREGNVWVATQEGVDRFRDIKVATYSVHEGLSDDQVRGVVAARDGSVWLSNANFLNVLKGTGVTAYRGNKELPGEEVTSIFEDRQGRMWIGIDKKLTIFDHDQFRTVGGAGNESAGPYMAIMDDPEGNLWAITSAGAHGALIRFEGEKLRQTIPFEQLPIAKAGAIATDLKSGVWLPLVNGDIAHWHDGKADIVQFHHASHTGNLTAILAVPDGTIYSSSALGVIGVRGDRSQMLTQSNGLPCSAVRSMVADPQSLWLYADCGIVSVDFSELEKWWRDPEALLSVRSIDSFDGAQPASASYYPGSSRSPDGRLWFANASVLQGIDPLHIPYNRVAPLVQIERVIADRVALPKEERLSLAPLTRTVEFDYASSSFAIPQKTQFRYRLEGYDQDWQSAGNRHQAIYTGLPPGRYQFRVAAMNNDGVWSATGALQTIEVRPAFYQTKWFIALCAAVITGAAWLAYLWRIRLVTAAVRIGAEARVKERERIARDLHDTLLQGVQGLMYRFQAATERLPKNESIRHELEKSLDYADELISQGREQVTSLRNALPATESLQDALNSVAMDLAKGRRTSFASNTQGTPRALTPLAKEELYRIGSEALINAFSHASADRIELEIVYETPHVSMRVRDDGVGFDVQSPPGESPGHFGLIGMQERAQRLKSRANVWSRVGAGTEISISVSDSIAYHDVSSGGFLAWLSARLRELRSSS